MGKNNEYLEISKQIVANIGGMDNIQGTAHCGSRLRIVLKCEEAESTSGSDQSVI